MKPRIIEYDNVLNQQRAEVYAEREKVLEGEDIHANVLDMIRDLAEENKIPWQIKGRIAGGTDAAAIQRSRSGVRVASISAPVRSIHCPNSVAKISDMKHGLRLAELFVDAVASGRIK